jgi:glycine/D-amino acid oxidase-like deaminating enzyme
MITSADVVVIGSGAFGASAAYHLARRGVKVAVLERATLVSRPPPAPPASRARSARRPR